MEGEVPAVATGGGCVTVLIMLPPRRSGDPSFIAGLARQMEQLRGRELPGFMSAQSFYMFIQDYIEARLVFVAVVLVGSCELNIIARA